MYKRSEEIWTLELIKIHSYNFLVCLDQMYMYNSLETSKLMKVFDLLFFEFVWGDRGYLAMTFSGDIWSFFFLVFCYSKSLVKKGQTFLGKVRRRTRADCQGFILAFADPQLWKNYWNAGKILEPHCVQKVFELWQWGAWAVCCCKGGSGSRGCSVCTARCPPTLVTGWSWLLHFHPLTSLVLFFSYSCFGLTLICSWDSILLPPPTYYTATGVLGA